MFLRTEPITPQDNIDFAPLLNKGVYLQIVIFEDPNGEFGYPIYLATYNGKPCHFHYTHNGNEVQLQQTLTDVWNFLND